MSSPLTAERACSRLSVHLATGCLSLRETLARTRLQQARLAALPEAEARAWRGALASFVSRLYWHCHFIQKLESQPDLEFDCLHPAYRGLRPAGEGEQRFQAWQRGETGWPFVDACMRALAATGWINFRMRAMLASVAAQHLWLDWRRPALHLARLFTDYEPGIHYAQMQMQSGTTGINTIRIYNPVKQGLDQDPQGDFVRRWLPELAAIPGAAVHQPWRLTALERQSMGLVWERDYPSPILDHETAARTARERVWAVRSGADYARLAREIQARHGSRASGIGQRGQVGRPRRSAKNPTRNAPSAQGQLAFDPPKEPS